MNLIILLGFLFAGYIIGQYFEKKHYQQLKEREQALKHISIVSSQWKQSIEADEECHVFGGGIVIGSDYFKTFVSGLRSIVGGRLTSYESLLDRGRREAILRMQEDAIKWGAHKLINIRVETATIGTSSSQQRLPCVELYAYGTAIRKISNLPHEIRS